MTTYEYPDYIIEQIEPKEGSRLRHIHAELKGRPCYIVNARVGEYCAIRYLPDYDDRFHNVRTSVVDRIECGARTALIETKNTLYYLVRCNPDDSTFRGVKVYTIEDAVDRVKTYFRDKNSRNFYVNGDEYFHIADDKTIRDLAENLLAAYKAIGVYYENAVCHSICSEALEVN